MMKNIRIVIRGERSRGVINSRLVDTVHIHQCNSSVVATWRCCQSASPFGGCGFKNLCHPFAYEGGSAWWWGTNMGLNRVLILTYEGQIINTHLDGTLPPYRGMGRGGGVKKVMNQ